MAHRMDSQWEIAGIRIGWDGIIGLVPMLGDILSALIALKTINMARKIGVPSTLLGRMLVNVAVETLLGEVPIAGDALDIAWKANLKNVSLVEQYLSEDIGDMDVEYSGPLWHGIVLLIVAILCSIGVSLLLWLYLIPLLSI